MSDRVTLAIIELSGEGVLSKYMSLRQRISLGMAIKAGVPESPAYLDKTLALAERIRKMPATFQTESVALEDKVIHLRYFNNGATVWVIEKDKGSVDENNQTQAFGYVDLYGHGLKNAELGYLSLDEYIEAGMELDIEFQPTTYKNLIEQNA